MKLFTSKLFAVVVLCCAITVSQNANAQCAAGETEYSIDIDAASSGFPAEMSWELIDDATSTVLLSTACGDYALGVNSSDQICLTDGSSYTINLYDDWGDGWNGGSWNIGSDTLCSTASGLANDGLAGDGTDDCIGQSLEESVSFTAGAILGCTDTASSSYNPCATVDDGSCVYPGCTDPCAANYDPLASPDDGSCAGFPTGAGDACASATALPGPGSYTQYNGMAVADTVDVTSCTFNDLIAVWFSYTIPTGLDTFKVYTCGSSYDTGLSFWDACGGTELACNDDGSFGPGGAAGSTCGGTIFSSMITLSDSGLAALEGTTILIRVAGYNGTSGCGDLVIEEVSGAACTAATSVTNLAATVGASTLSLTWDAVPGSVGCQVNYGPSGGPFFGTSNILGSGVSSAVVPLSIIPAGNYQLRVRCGCQITPTIIATGYSNVVQITVPSPRLGEFAEVTLSPNPASDMINLAYNGAANQNVSFSIVNIIGSEVANITTDVVEGLNNFQFDLSNMESGMYFLQITSGEGSFSEQFEVIK